MFKHENLEPYEVTLSNTAIETAVKNTLQLYVQRADFYKSLHYVLSFISVILNASIPVISHISFHQGKILVTVISGITAISTSTVTLLSTKDKWTQYRIYAEKLKSECIQYSGRAGAYEEDNDMKREKLFIKRFQAVEITDLKNWKQLIDKSAAQH